MPSHNGTFFNNVFKAFGEHGTHSSVQWPKKWNNKQTRRLFCLCQLREIYLSLHDPCTIYRFLLWNTNESPSSTVTQNLPVADKPPGYLEGVCTHTTHRIWLLSTRSGANKIMDLQRNKTNILQPGRKCYDEGTSQCYLTEALSCSSETHLKRIYNTWWQYQRAPPTKSYAVKELDLIY